MRPFVPIIVGAVLLLLLSALIMFWNPSGPSPAPVPVRPPGTSVLSHGGPGPTRQERSTIENPPSTIAEPTTAR